ncbi:MAG: hypothetical protein R2781_10725 [Flavobacteriaceae bacterium]
MKRILNLLALCVIVSACNNKDFSIDEFNKPALLKDTSPLLIEILDSNKTQITFENRIEESVPLNYFNFMHVYMGAGVARADFNNYGLPDIFFVSNLFQDQLYLNKGNLKFEDITAQSGITKADASKGVILLNDGKANFTAVSYKQSGFWAPYNAKSLVLLKGKQQDYIFVCNNNDALQVFQLSNNP